MPLRLDNNSDLKVNKKKTTTTVNDAWRKFYNQVVNLVKS